MILTTSSRAARRPGFTLIELLTVISIIAVLMAIGVGTYFRVRVSQEEKATETTLNKLQSEFDLQSRSVLDSCQDEVRNDKVPTGVMTLAGNDNLRAKVIWTKMRLKQEFPQNFWEALKWPQTVNMPAKYARDLEPTGTLSPVLPGNLTIDRHMQESAVLLYMALAKGRRGNNSFRPNEHLGPHAVSRIQLLIDPNSPVSQANPVKEFEIFVDTWGTPIAFIRWPFGAAGSDLNQPPYQAKNNSGQPVDPQDPEKTLIRSDWYNTQLRTGFETLVGHPVNNPPLNLTPVIMSAGRDLKWGLDGTGTLARQSSDEDDNVYAYRIKGVSRTN